MAKSKRQIDAAVHVFKERLKEFLPHAETELIYRPGDGHDAWLNIKTSPCNPADREDLVNRTIGLDLDIWDETGVSIVSFVVTKQPEEAHHG